MHQMSEINRFNYDPELRDHVMTRLDDEARRPFFNEFTVEDASRSLSYLLRHEPRGGGRLLPSRVDGYAEIGELRDFYMRKYRVSAMAVKTDDVLQVVTTPDNKGKYRFKIARPEGLAIGRSPVDPNHGIRIRAMNGLSFEIEKDDNKVWTPSSNSRIVHVTTFENWK